jgi:hypothetical protein
LAVFELFVRFEFDGRRDLLPLDVDGPYGIGGSAPSSAGLPMIKSDRLMPPSSPPLPFFRFTTFAASFGARARLPALKAAAGIR